MFDGEVRAKTDAVPPTKIEKFPQGAFRN